MKAQVKVGQNYVTGEGDTPLDVFKEIAVLTEAFGDTQCARCHGDSFRYVVRKASDAKGKKEYTYPEQHCLNKDCRAKLSFSQGDEGVIYPARWQKVKTEDGYEYLMKDGKRVQRGQWGWTIYNRETGEEE